MLSSKRAFFVVSVVLFVFVWVVVGYAWLNSQTDDGGEEGTSTTATEWHKVRSREDNLAFEYPVWEGVELVTAPTRWELQSDKGTVLAVDISERGVDELAADERFKDLSFRSYTLANFPAWRAEIKGTGMDREWYILAREDGDYVWVVVLYEHMQGVEEPKSIVRKLLNSVSPITGP